MAKKKPIPMIAAREKGICLQCNQPMIEVGRNEYRVFFKCGCKRNKGVDWDWEHAIVDGLEYELGTAGSFVHDCPLCDGVTFRQIMSNELCVFCGKSEIKPRLARTDLCPG